MEKHPDPHDHIHYEGEIFLKKQWFIQQKMDVKISDFYDMKTKKVIGQGQFGTAYSIKMRYQNDYRAIKVIPKARIVNAKELISEINIMKSLDHPNVIKLYEIYEDSRNIYLCMELCSGGELFDKITSSGKISEEDTRNLFRQSVSAINYCHSNGIVHRDLKPENFILLNDSKDSPIKIIDFGLSCYMGSANMTLKAGSAYYMSPEVLDGNYTMLCDTWSLGVILFIMLSGVPPFYGKNDVQIFEKIKKGEYNLGIKQLEHVSESAKDLIKKCLVPETTRLTASQILNHPWMKENLPETKLELTLNSLQDFVKGEKLKRIVITYIASQMAENDISELDLNNDGVLTMEEIRQSMATTLTEDERKELERCFQFIDSDSSGSIDYTEFIAASLTKNQYLAEDKLLNSFKMLDLDGSGKIDKSELRKILCQDKQFCHHNEDYWDKLIQEADTNGDGEIDYDEFKNLMSK